MRAREALQIGIPVVLTLVLLFLLIVNRSDFGVQSIAECDILEKTRNIHQYTETLLNIIKIFFVSTCIAWIVVT